MSASNIHELVGHRSLTLPRPDPAYGKPRPMTGFLATLTTEQRKLALKPMVQESLGDPGKVANKG